jgi:EAL domain-containing protein (putative c-di-GMP-specific phosphodiesterase class I)
MKAARAAPKSIIFEIDEPDLLNRPQSVSQFVAAIRAAGAGVLVDGFGRRAVSFTPLKALQLDFVKVDGSIVRKLLTSEVARTKMNAMLRVGQAIGFGLIAECVEDQDVLTRLKALGVGYAQGFGIYQPQPIDSLAG